MTEITQKNVNYRRKPCIHIYTLSLCKLDMFHWNRCVPHTKLHSGQDMLYKNQSKGNNSKMEQGRVMVLVQCTSSHCQKHAY